MIKPEHVYFKNNPFYILKASPKDNLEVLAQKYKLALVEATYEHSFIMGQAYQDLCATRPRLKAELAWVLEAEVNPEQILEMLHASNDLSTAKFSPLSIINIGLNRYLENPAAQGVSFVQTALNWVHGWTQLKRGLILEQINQTRSAAGFAMVKQKAFEVDFIKLCDAQRLALLSNINQFEQIAPRLSEEGLAIEEDPYKQVEAQQIYFSKSFQYGLLALRGEELAMQYLTELQIEIPLRISEFWQQHSAESRELALAAYIEKIKHFEQVYKFLQRLQGVYKNKLKVVNVDTARLSKAIFSVMRPDQVELKNSLLSKQLEPDELKQLIAENIYCAVLLQDLLLQAGIFSPDRDALKLKEQSEKYRNQYYYPEAAKQHAPAIAELYRNALQAVDELKKIEKIGVQQDKKCEVDRANQLIERYLDSIPVAFEVELMANRDDDARAALYFTVLQPLLNEELMHTHHLHNYTIAVTALKDHFKKYPITDRYGQEFEEQLNTIFHNLSQSFALEYEKGSDALLHTALQNQALQKLLMHPDLKESDRTRLNEINRAVERYEQGKVNSKGSSKSRASLLIAAVTTAISASIYTLYHLSKLL